MLDEVRAQAGRAVRAVSEVLLRKRVAWRHMFIGDDGRPNRAGEIALRDLVEFCRAFEPLAEYTEAGSIDPLATMKAEGRREVVLFVFKRLGLDQASAYRLAQKE